MAVYRKQKGIRFDRAYLNDALRNEYGLNVLFILSFVSLSSKSIFFYAPLIIHFVIGINEALSLFWNNNPILLKYAPNLIASIKNMKKYLMVFKSKIEFIYFIVSIVLTLLNFSRLFSLLIYGQFVILKLRTSQDFNEGIAEVDAMIANITIKIGLIGVYDKVRGVCRSIKNRFAQWINDGCVYTCKFELC